VLPPRPGVRQRHLWRRQLQVRRCVGEANAKLDECHVSHHTFPAALYWITFA
jgi:hypothetical protein